MRLAFKFATWAVFCIALLGCETKLEKPAQYVRVPGVSSTEITIGSSLALEGHASYLGTQTLRGAQSYLRNVNALGGVHGRLITLQAMDDGYDPTRCLANTHRLVSSGNIFSLFGFVGTPTTVRVLPLIEEAKIPLVGAFSGANALRVPFNPYVFNIRASYYQETKAAVELLVSQMQCKRIAVFYQYDAYGFDGLMGTELALREVGLAPVARGSYVRGAVDIDEALHKIVTAQPDAVVLVGTYEPCAEFITKADALGLDAAFFNLSFVGAEELARLLPDDIKGDVLVSQVVPPPFSPQVHELMGIAEEYVRHLKELYPDDVPNAVGLEGYVNARVMVEGLRRAGRNLTRESFMKALESMGKFPLGGKASVAFTPEDHQGLEMVYYTVLEDGEFKLIDDTYLHLKRSAAVKFEEQVTQ
ncbi:ABC transporter substrate-binding protein [Halodesulfovibrio sp.]|jgi:ABC-type branched-subunit amino acid transport system substrate-binding protein|uniref:ABC transporter substrate-binding protein n=1 Tax=Halodesulfovibrio sp. TaxID=1912772 RepID=UPI0025CF5D63|nr:ABC transporter substrate-binding protein [Halodesulfovibrio sp.]MCT4535397.1 ABC transporter substrate-binding protein [Halodesulfovibrio sp.]MCT4626210.1 ABC transporter substrate-binding protein [Halodesulfovibrio sp.]